MTVLKTWLFSILLLSAQTDTEKFAEGRIALDRYKDCKAADAALDSVSENGHKQAMWIYYKARTQECLQNYEASIGYYQQYLKSVPGNSEIIDKIAEMRYRLRKVEEQNRQHIADQEELERRRLDLSGQWRISQSCDDLGGQIIDLKQSSISVVSGDPNALISLEGHTMDGKRKLNYGIKKNGIYYLGFTDVWSRRAKAACPNDTNDPAPDTNFELRLSADGTELEGIGTFWYIDTANCETWPKDKRCTWRRIK